MALFKVPIKDVNFLASYLKLQNAENNTSLVFNLLNGFTVTAGHSKGAAVALLTDTAQSNFNPNTNAVISIAPGVYGPTQVKTMFKSASQVVVPTLFLLGDQDCCNEVHVQTEPIYNNISSTEKTIVLLKGANHCQWSTPVKGACALPCSSCGDLNRVQQQAEGLVVIKIFLEAASSGGLESFNQYLKGAQDQGVLQYRTETIARDLKTRCPCS